MAKAHEASDQMLSDVIRESDSLERELTELSRILEVEEASLKKLKRMIKKEDEEITVINEKRKAVAEDIGRLEAREKFLSEAIENSQKSTSLLSQMEYQARENLLQLKKKNAIEKEQIFSSMKYKLKAIDDLMEEGRKIPELAQLEDAVKLLARKRTENELLVKKYKDTKGKASIVNGQQERNEELKLLDELESTGSETNICAIRARASLMDLSGETEIQTREPELVSSTDLYNQRSKVRIEIDSDGEHVLNEIDDMKNTKDHPVSSTDAVNDYTESLQNAYSPTENESGEVIKDTSSSKDFPDDCAKYSGSCDSYSDDERFGSKRKTVFPTPRTNQRYIKGGLSILSRKSAKLLDDAYSSNTCSNDREIQSDVHDQEDLSQENKNVQLLLKSDKKKDCQSKMIDEKNQNRIDPRLLVDSNFEVEKQTQDEAGIDTPENRNSLNELFSEDLGNSIDSKSQLVGTNRTNKNTVHQSNTDVETLQIDAANISSKTSPESVHPRDCYPAANVCQDNEVPESDSVYRSPKTCTTGEAKECTDVCESRILPLPDVSINGDYSPHEPESFGPAGTVMESASTSYEAGADQMNNQITQTQRIANTTVSSCSQLCEGSRVESIEPDPIKDTLAFKFRNSHQPENKSNKDDEISLANSHFSDRMSNFSSGFTAVHEDGDSMPGKSIDSSLERKNPKTYDAMKGQRYFIGTNGYDDNIVQKTGFGLMPDDTPGSQKTSLELLERKEAKDYVEQNNAGSKHEEANTNFRLRQTTSPVRKEVFGVKANSRELNYMSFLDEGIENKFENYSESAAINDNKFVKSPCEKSDKDLNVSIFNQGSTFSFGSFSTTGLARKESKVDSSSARDFGFGNAVDERSKFDNSNEFGFNFHAYDDNDKNDFANFFVNNNEGEESKDSASFHFKFGGNDDDDDDDKAGTFAFF